MRKIIKYTWLSTTIAAALSTFSLIDQSHTHAAVHMHPDHVHHRSNHHSRRRDEHLHHTGTGHKRRKKPSNRAF